MHIKIFIDDLQEVSGGSVRYLMALLNFDWICANRQWIPALRERLDNIYATTQKSSDNPSLLGHYREIYRTYSSRNPKEALRATYYANKAFFDQIRAKT